MQGEFIVIDSGRVFELQCKESFMQIRIRADKEFLSARAGDLSQREGIVNRRYFCLRESLKEEQLENDFAEIERELRAMDEAEADKKAVKKPKPKQEDEV